MCSFSSLGTPIPPTPLLQAYSVSLKAPIPQGNGFLWAPATRKPLSPQPRTPDSDSVLRWLQGQLLSEPFLASSLPSSRRLDLLTKPSFVSPPILRLISGRPGHLLAVWRVPYRLQSPFPVIGQRASTWQDCYKTPMNCYLIPWAKQTLEGQPQNLTTTEYQYSMDRDESRF